jgi:hypothetical protein
VGVPGVGRIKCLPGRLAAVVDVVEEGGGHTLGYVARYGPQQVLAETNPYRDHSTQTGAVTFGAPDILDQVARSANAAPPTTRCTPS